MYISSDDLLLSIVHSVLNNLAKVKQTNAPNFRQEVKFFGPDDNRNCSMTLHCALCHRNTGCPKNVSHR